MRLFKLVLASLLAVLTLGAAVQSASAYDASITPGGGFTATGTVTFSDAGGLLNIACPYTFDGTFFNGPVPLTAGSQFGQVDAVTIGGCPGGSAITLNDEPWPLLLRTVLGSAPNAVTGLLFDISGFGWQLSWSIFGIPTICLYGGTIGALAVISSSATIPSITLLPNTVPKVNGSQNCPSSARFNGTLAVSPAHTIVIA